MAAPVLASVLANGRTVYRQGGRFISKAKYELERRRLSSGRIGTAAQAQRERGVEQWLRAQLGAPPAGKTWQVIASKYPDRFSDYLEDFDG